MVKSFARDEKGAIAVAFALVAPVFIAMIGCGFDLWQKEDLASATRFTAQSAAASCAAILNAPNGTESAATTRAQAVVTANRPLFTSGTTVAAPVITFSGGLCQVSLQATVPYLWPLPPFTGNAVVTVAGAA